MDLNMTSVRRTLKYHTRMHSGAEFQVDKLLGFVAFSKMRIIELEGTSATGFSETNISIRLLKGKQGVNYNVFTFENLLYF